MRTSSADLRNAIQKEVFVRADRETRIVAIDEATHSEWLFDFRQLLLQPQWLDLYAELFWERYADRYPFQVCGMESAAISLVTAIVMKGVQRGTPVNGLYIRKSRKRYGLMKQIEGSPSSDPIIIVDDLINSGKTIDKQIKILTDADLKVLEVFVLLSFRDLSAYGAIAAPITAIFTLKDFDLQLLETKSPEIPTNSFKVLWKFQAPNPSRNYVVPKSTPAIDERHVYMGSDAGVFYALDKDTGNIVWTFQTGKHPKDKGIFSSPLVHEGIVYFGAYDGNVYALDATTGKERWRYTKADWIGSSPALSEKNGLLYIGLEFGLWRKHGGIAALDCKSGKEVWSDTAAEFTHCSPLYIPEADMVVIGSNDSIVYAYHAKDGTILWRVPVEGELKASFAYNAKEKSIFFGTMSGVFYSLSFDGTIIFAKEVGAAIYSTPWVEGTRVYISSLDKYIYAFDSTTGNEMWSFATAGRIFASPIVQNGSLWCGSNDGRLYEIDLTTGKLKRFFQASERIVNKIYIDDSSENIFFSTQANEIYSLKRVSV